MILQAPRPWRLLWYLVLGWLLLFAMAVTLGAQELPMAKRPATAPANAELLRQVQAADLMSELLTWSGDRANARVDAMGQFLQRNNLLQAFRQGPAGKAQRHLAYNELFKGAVSFVATDGTRYADPEFARLSDAQLRQELTALQAYNLPLYQHLCKQRDLANAMREYLKAQGRFDAYLAWAGEELKNIEHAATTHPATRPADIAAKLETLPEEMKDAAWKQAQAKGVSREQFDADWRFVRERYRDRIAARVRGARDLARSLAGGVPADAAPAAAVLVPAPGATNPEPLLQQNDPRWQEGYYQPEANWDTWNDSYPDVYRYHPRGGIYRSYDRRVNQDYDLRVGQERDRRVNAEFDRRQNIRIDPRENY